MLKLFILLLNLSEVRMIDKYSWYKADQRRKKIAKEKREKAARYVEEMNKRANENRDTSVSS